MNRVQKMALFVFINLTVAIVVSGSAVAILYFRDVSGAWRGLGLLALAGISGVAPVIFKEDRQNVGYDERDRCFGQRAALAGFGGAYLVVGLTTMLPFMILGPGGQIDTGWLPMIFLTALITNFYVWSIAILTQYGLWNQNK